MRILHLDAGREMRGGQWQVLRLIEGLAAAGVESTLLARDGGAAVRGRAPAGLRVEPLGLARACCWPARHDLVHAHDARSHTLAALVAPARRWWSRGAWPSRRGIRAVPLEVRHARARYLAVSEFVKSRPGGRRRAGGEDRGGLRRRAAARVRAGADRRVRGRRRIATIRAKARRWRSKPRAWPASS